MLGSLYRRLADLLPADHLRQAGHGVVRSQRRRTDARGADGRRSCGDGRRRVRASCDPRHLRGRPDEHALRRDLPGTDSWPHPARHHGPVLDERPTTRPATRKRSPSCIGYLDDGWGTGVSAEVFAQSLADDAGGARRVRPDGTGRRKSPDDPGRARQRRAQRRSACCPGDLGPDAGHPHARRSHGPDRATAAGWPRTSPGDGSSRWTASTSGSIVERWPTRSRRS